MAGLAARHSSTDGRATTMPITGPREPELMNVIATGASASAISTRLRSDLRAHEQEEQDQRHLAHRAPESDHVDRRVQRVAVGELLVGRCPLASWYEL